MIKGIDLQVESNNFNVILGSINEKNPTTIYTVISSWLSPLTKEDVEYGKMIKELNKKIKSFIFNNKLENAINDMSIFDFSLKESGLRYGKKSYLSLEITYYQNFKETLSLEELAPKITELSNNLIKEIFLPLEYFEFNKKKNI